MSRGRRDQRGSMSIEVLLLTPVLVAAIIIIAAGGRYVQARGEASDAAFAAARAASLTTNQAAAVAAGRQAAARSFADRGMSCAGITVSIDAHDFRPGGDVRATVTCTADLADLAGIGLPGHKSFTATASVPLDVHREFP